MDGTARPPCGTGVKLPSVVDPGEMVSNPIPGGGWTPPRASDTPHAFGGALGLAFHVAEPRATRDIDVNVFVPVDAAPAVFAAMPAGVPYWADIEAMLEVGAIDTPTVSRWLVDLLGPDDHRVRRLADLVARQPPPRDPRFGT